MDSFYVHQDDVLRQRNEELLQDARHNYLNYLRGMFEDGFFQQYPQEFFASISNQWLTDSHKTIILGLAGFDRGYRDPISQALFFADAYSCGMNQT